MGHGMCGWRGKEYGHEMMAIPMPMAIFGMMVAMMLGALCGMMMGKKAAMMHGGPMMYGGGYGKKMWKKKAMMGHHHHGWGMAACCEPHDHQPQEMQHKGMGEQPEGEGAQ